MAEEPRPPAKKILTAADILTADDLGLEEIDVPEWGGVVYVRGLTGAERGSLEAQATSQQNRKGVLPEEFFQRMRAKIAVMSVVDADGKRLFTAEQISALSEKSGRALDRIFEVAQRLSGLTQRDIEEMKKNSDSAPADDSPSS